jgi:predicted nucleic acid-binding protein
LKPVVLDASVAVKWYLPRANETLVDEALDLLNRHVKQQIRFIVPDFFWAEFGNVLWKTLRLGRLPERSVRAAIQEARQWGIVATPADELLDRALSIAISNDRAVYDSLYVALAIHANTEMITADERLVNALGSRFPVRWLASI